MSRGPNHFVISVITAWKIMVISTMWIAGNSETGEKMERMKLNIE